MRDHDAAPAATQPVALPMVVAFDSAIIDVLGWWTLAHFYSANITGDLTQAAAYVLPNMHRHALEIAALPVFVLGLLASYVTVRRFETDRTLTVRLMFCGQSAVLAAACAAVGIGGTVSTSLGADQQLALGLLCVLAISMSNATMNIIDHDAPTTWALTANCVRGGVALLDLASGRGDAAARARDRAIWNLTWPTVIAFLCGGIVAAAAYRLLGHRAWLVPLAATTFAAAATWHPAVRRALDHPAGGKDA